MTIVRGQVVMEDGEVLRVMAGTWPANIEKNMINNEKFIFHKNISLNPVKTGR